MIDPDPDRRFDTAKGAAALRRLRGVALGIVVLAFGVSGLFKLLRPESGLNLMSRALETPRAQRAGGCLELALALWLASGRNPKLGPGVAAGTLAALGLLIASELRRPHPLPCGCFPTAVVPVGGPAVRKELWIALGRDGFLIVLCGVAGSRAVPATVAAPVSFQRYA